MEIFLRCWFYSNVGKIPGNERLGKLPLAKSLSDCNGTAKITVSSLFHGTIGNGSVYTVPSRYCVKNLNLTACLP